MEKKYEKNWTWLFSCAYFCELRERGWHQKGIFYGDEIKKGF